MKVVVVAGGTGGHIYPAIAIINKIKKEAKNSEFLYIGTTDRMEKDIIPKLGIEFVGLKMSGLNRKNIFSNINVFKMYISAIKEAKKIIKKFNPDIVIGAGGYITAPVLYAASKMGYKTIIHEQNSIPGLSNKFLSKLVDKVCVSLPNSEKYFDKKKTVYTGNPRSEEIVSVKKTSKSNLGFNKDKKLVVIVMGSLGSVTMTEKIKELIPKFKNKDYQVLIISGNNYYEEYQKLDIPKNVLVVPFLDSLINLLKDSDLIISRAGASTIAEITAIGLPAILVPSPYVTHNHQFMNAKELEENGACILIEEKDFSSEAILENIKDLLNDKEKYTGMKTSSRNMGVPDSATRIYNEIRKLIG